MSVSVSIVRRFQCKLAFLIARLGVFLLKRSGVYSGYFSDWRWAVFDHAEREGMHILPVHFYSPVPEVSRLTLDDQTPVFVSADAEVLDKAVVEITEMVDRYGDAFKEIAGRREKEVITDFRFGAAPYSTLEAEVLYGLVRSRKPDQIIEIGCGHTTLLISEAIRAEQGSGYLPAFECIEPYRPSFLNTLPSEVTAFHDTPLQSVPIERFEALGPGDILFIDSSHVIKYQSDVVYEIAQIIPRLKPGVLVHFHDVFLPYDYPTVWLRDSKFFWNEQYMVAALVESSPRYRIRYPLHQLFRQRREDLQRLFPLLGDSGFGPGAYWLEVCSVEPKSGSV